jgi:hypothetical protein
VIVRAVASISIAGAVAVALFGCQDSDRREACEGGLDLSDYRVRGKQLIGDLDADAGGSCHSARRRKPPVARYVEPLLQHWGALAGERSHFFLNCRRPHRQDVITQIRLTQDR